MAIRLESSNCCDSVPDDHRHPSLQKREQYKLVVLGDSGVGKTNIVKRFTTNTFSHDSETTIGAAFQVYRDSSDITLQIWDTAGQERYAQLVPLYYRGAHGAILVYDITDRHSFERAKRWRGELEKYGETSAVICLVGNKCDLAQQRVVSVAEAQTYASDENLIFFETSALRNSPPVSAIFTKLTVEMQRQQRLRAPPIGKGVIPLMPTSPKPKRQPVDEGTCCIIL